MKSRKTGKRIATAAALLVLACSIRADRVGAADTAPRPEPATRFQQLFRSGGTTRPRPHGGGKPPTLRPGARRTREGRASLAGRRGRADSRCALRPRLLPPPSHELELARSRDERRNDDRDDHGPGAEHALLVAGAGVVRASSFAPAGGRAADPVAGACHAGGRADRAGAGGRGGAPRRNRIASFSRRTPAVCVDVRVEVRGRESVRPRHHLGRTRPPRRIRQRHQ